MAAGAILYALVSKQKKHSQSFHSIKSVGTEGSGWGIKNRKKFLALLTIGIIDIAARYSLLTFLPFLLLQKGIPVTRFGFALTLLFVGGAVGKFACGILAEWFGIIPMVVGTEVLTTAGILSLTMLPASWIWFVLPLVGIVLNGTSSVLYATVAEMISPASRSRGYGLYYAITLGSGALSPLAFGLLTDLMGLSFTIVMTALMLVITLPLSRHLSPKS
jgi:MFS family permease